MKNTFDLKTLITLIGYILGLIVPILFYEQFTCEIRLTIVSITSFLSISLILGFRIIDAINYEHQLEIQKLKEQHLEEKISNLEENYKNLDASLDEATKELKAIQYIGPEMLNLGKILQNQMQNTNSK